MGRGIVGSAHGGSIAAIESESDVLIGNGLAVLAVEVDAGGFNRGEGMRRVALRRDVERDLGLAGRVELVIGDGQNGLGTANPVVLLSPFWKIWSSTSVSWVRLLSADCTMCLALILT